MDFKCKFSMYSVGDRIMDGVFVDIIGTWELQKAKEENWSRKRLIDSAVYAIHWGDSLAYIEGVLLSTKEAWAVLVEEALKDGALMECITEEMEDSVYEEYEEYLDSLIDGEY